MLKKGDAACEGTGISPLHAATFQEVANKLKCVIASRAVGKFATGLIAEGYATKGFHNKAKSCDWGPMAGFVLADPRFTKDPNTKGQKQQIADAMKHGASEVPLLISKTRKDWLINNNLFKITKSDSQEVIGSAAKEGLSLSFLLKNTTKVSATGQPLYSVHWRSHEMHHIRLRQPPHTGQPWAPVMAMRDPRCTVPASSYLSATTGDYDLFAVWTSKETYKPDVDNRLVSHATLEKNIKDKVKNTGEDQHLGNMTNTVRAVREQLNSSFKQKGYTGGDLIHHSDEGGRPFVKNIDFPVFAVIPNNIEGAYLIETFEDLREFITAEMNGQYAPVFNPGWMNELTRKGLKKESDPYWKNGMNELTGEELKAQIIGFDRSTLKRIEPR